MATESLENHTEAKMNSDSERKVIIYIATSLDGFIAKADDDIDFLSAVDREGEDYGYSDFIKTVDATIVGRKTYDKVLSMGYEYPHQGKDSYIITRTPRPSIGTVKFYTGNLKELVTKLKSEQGKNIFVDGGAEIVNQLLRESLIDELYISVIPILLGDGIALFQGGYQELKIKLIDSKYFESGLVQSHYVRSDF